MHRNELHSTLDNTDALPASEPRFDVERVARQHGAALYRRALGLTSDPAAAWDLLQSTYERALRTAPLDMTDAKALSWISVVMRNIYLDLFRARSRRPEILMEEMEIMPAPEGDDEPPWSHLTLDEIRACVARLTEPLRDVYELHALQGLSYAEISSRLRLPPATVGTRLLRAREKLRKALGRQVNGRSRVRPLHQAPAWAAQ